MAHDVIDLSPHAWAQKRMDARAAEDVCFSGRDGDCFWDKCPQLTNYQNYCPRAAAEEANDE